MPELEVGPPELNAEESRALCRRVVATWKEVVGRGPVRAVVYAGPASVTIVLRGILTAAEQTLLDGGRPETVIESRRHLFDAARPALEAAVEEASRRAVQTALYDIDPKHEICVMVFSFEDRSAG